MTSHMEPPARYLVTASKLKILAAQQLAFDIYRHTIHAYDHQWTKYSPSSPPTLDIPAGIPVLMEIMKELYRGPIHHSVCLWYSYHQSEVFFDCKPVKCTDSLAFKPNGTVNYLKTAKNLLLGDVVSLSHVQKFRFACINCMAEDIQNLWPFVSDHPSVMNNNAQKHPMIHYWISVMRGDVGLHQLPGHNGNDADSLEKLAKILIKMEWTPLEYFWNFFSNDELVTFAVKLIKNIRENIQSTTAEQLLLKLSSEQLRLIQIKQNDVIKNLVLYFFKEPSLFSRSFNQVWNYLMNIIRQSEFQSMMVTLIEKTFRGVFGGCQTINEMWINTPVKVKNQLLISEEYLDNLFDALDGKKFTLIGECTIISDCNYYRDMSFFITLLSELSFQTRRRIWHKYWCSLIIGTSPRFLQQIMKMCFNNDDEITLFKERDMLYFPNIHDFCCLTITIKCVKGLNEYLNFCSDNANFTSIVKREILASADVRKAFLKTALFLKSERFIENAHRAFIEFDKFIDSAFIKEDDARYYKNNIMKSSKRLQNLYANVDKNKIGVSWM